MSETTSDTAITLKGASGLVTYDYGEYTNIGTDHVDKCSSRIPFLSVLQPLSKAVKKGNEKYVEGAKPGDFLLGDQRIDGTEGCFFIPIVERHRLLEKTCDPATGKLNAQSETVAEYDPFGPEAEAARAKYGKDTWKWRSEKGNLLIERYDMFGVVFDTLDELNSLTGGRPATIGFERTKLSAREAITSAFKNIPPGKRPPLFAARVKLVVREESRKSGDFFNIRPTWAVGNDFASSLISPDSETWKKWAPQAKAIAEGITTGKFAADEGTNEAPESHDDDIPF